MGQDVAIHIRIGKDLRRRLDERADQERRSRSNMAALFIEDGLDARDARDALTAVGSQPELHRVLDRLVDTAVEYQARPPDLRPYTTGGDDDTPA